MTQVSSPTNLAWIQGRILVKGPSDVSNVNAIQDQISLKPLSALQGKTTLNVSSVGQQEIPSTPNPASIYKMGLQVYDEISHNMNGNPANPPVPALVTKLASIGIGPGRAPSVEFNETIKSALQAGIIQGDKLIKSKWLNVGK